MNYKGLGVAHWNPKDWLSNNGNIGQSHVVITDALLSFDAEIAGLPDGEVETIMIRSASGLVK